MCEVAQGHTGLGHLPSKIKKQPSARAARLKKLQNHRQALFYLAWSLAFALRLSFVFWMISSWLWGWKLQAEHFIIAKCTPATCQMGWGGRQLGSCWPLWSRPRCILADSFLRFPLLGMSDLFAAELRFACRCLLLHLLLFVGRFWIPMQEDEQILLLMVRILHELSVLQYQWWQGIRRLGSCRFLHPPY